MLNLFQHPSRRPARSALADALFRRSGLVTESSAWAEKWTLKQVQGDGLGAKRGPLHTQTIALSARSLSFWQRSMLAAWVITPALHSAKLTSATGSTQNIVLPAP